MVLAGSPRPRRRGALHVSLKEGDGEAWSTHGNVAAPRHFVYWREEPLRDALEAAGWSVDEVTRRDGRAASAGSTCWRRRRRHEAHGVLGPDGAGAGRAYARSWADQYVMGELGGRTAQEALDAGVPPKQVWAAVWRALELPATER